MGQSLKTKNSGPIKARPNRYATAKYINEKLRDFSIPYEKLLVTSGTTIYSDGSEAKHRITERFFADGYRLIFNGDSSKVFLLCRIIKHYTEDDWINPATVNETHRFEVEADLSKVSDIIIRRDRHKELYNVKTVFGSEWKFQSYESDRLELGFSSECVKYLIVGDDPQYNNFFIVALRDGEENLFEKMRNVFNNLISFYPKDGSDPFEN